MSVFSTCRPSISFHKFYHISYVSVFSTCRASMQEECLITSSILHYISYTNIWYSQLYCNYCIGIIFDNFYTKIIFRENKLSHGGKWIIIFLCTKCTSVYMYMTPDKLISEIQWKLLKFLSHFETDKYSEPYIFVKIPSYSVFFYVTMVPLSKFSIHNISLKQFASDL